MSNPGLPEKMPTLCGIVLLDMDWVISHQHAAWRRGEAPFPIYAVETPR